MGGRGARSSAGKGKITSSDFEKIGNRWQKGGHDRIYLKDEIKTQIMDTQASNGVEIRKHFNGRQRNNLKVYFDNKTKEVVLTSGTDDAKEEFKKALTKVIRKNK